MKIITVIFFTLFMTSALAVETCDNSGQSELNDSYIKDSDVYGDDFSDETNASDEELRWYIDLSKHLLKNNDININVIALSHLNLMSADVINLEIDFPILDSKTKLSVLNKAIESPDVSTSTLLSARSMCLEPDMHGKCYVERFNQKLFYQDPENLNIYLDTLEQAVKDSDGEMIDIVLQQMSQAKYSRMFNPLSIELGDAIDEYILENSIVNVEKMDTFDELRNSELEFDVDSVMKQSSLQSYHVINFIYTPALRPLFLACEDFQKDLHYCKKIAKILIKNSDTAMMTMMGYGLDEKFDEITGDTKSLAESQAASEAFKDYQMCIVQNHALSNNILEMFEPKFLAIITQGKHEGANLERAALFLYEKYKDSKEGAVDPRTCGLRYVEG